MSDKLGSEMIYARTTVSELSHSFSGIREADMISTTTGSQNQAADIISSKILETSDMISRAAEAAEQSAHPTMETTTIIQDIALAISQLNMSIELVREQVDRFTVK